MDSFFSLFAYSFHQVVFKLIVIAVLVLTLVVLVLALALVLGDMVLITSLVSNTLVTR